MNRKFVIGLFICLLLCGGFLFFFPTEVSKDVTIRFSCLSNIKQQVNALQQYAADNGDRIPPYYSFDGPADSERYVDCMKLYSKGDEHYPIFKCPAIHLNPTRHPNLIPIEPTSDDFAYAHCLTLKGVIPDFASGNRTLSLSSLVDNGANIGYIRDLLVADSNGSQKLLSPHGNYFMVGYLDGHAKSKKIVELSSDL